jgi:hypothetical protein
VCGGGNGKEFGDSFNNANNNCLNCFQAISI